MKTVRRFSNLAEAGFSKSLLESAGIRCFLAGEDNFTLGYGPGIGEMLLQVEDEDFDHAMRVLQNGPDAETPPKAAPKDDEPRDRPAQIPKGLFIAIVIAFIVLLLVGSKVMEEQKRARIHSQLTGDTRKVEYDDDGNGRPDHFVHYVKGHIHDTSTDRNGDGKEDEWIVYNEKGRPVSVVADDNFDGRPDRWAEYGKGSTETIKFDTDFNGRPDWFTTYEYGIAVKSDCIVDGAGPVIRREIYAYGVLLEEWVDDDRDGKFDKKFTFDPFGNRSGPIAVEK